MAVLLRPSGLRARLPEPTAAEYSLMSRYSGFLYQTSHEGRPILEDLKDNGVFLGDMNGVSEASGNTRAGEGHLYAQYGMCVCKGQGREHEGCEGAC